MKNPVPTWRVGIFASMIGIIMALGGGFYWSGALAERVNYLERSEAAGIPRGEARRAYRKIDGRLGEIEKNQAAQKERSKAAEKQRDRQERKIDGLIRALVPSGAARP